MKKQSAVGGPRNGAGLAADTGGAKTWRHTVTLDAATAANMREIGSGNLSRGIREASRRLSANAEIKGLVGSFASPA